MYMYTNELYSLLLYMFVKLSSVCLHGYSIKLLLTYLLNYLSTSDDIGISLSTGHVR